MNLLREYIRALVEQNEDEDPVREDRMKVAQLFWGTGAGMGIQMAEMTPGLEDLAKKFEEFRVIVEEFIDLSDRFMAQGAANEPIHNNAIAKAKNEIQKAVTKLTVDEMQWADKEVLHATQKWEKMFLKTVTYVRWSGSGTSVVALLNPDDYEALKDWVNV